MNLGWVLQDFVYADMLGVRFGSPSNMLARFSLCREVPVLLRPLGSYRWIAATGKKEDDKINSLSKLHIYFYQSTDNYHARVAYWSNRIARIEWTRRRRRPISRDLYAANWFSQGHAHFYWHVKLKVISQQIDRFWNTWMCGVAVILYAIWYPFALRCARDSWRVTLSNF